MSASSDASLNIQGTRPKGVPTKFAAAARTGDIGRGWGLNTASKFSAFQSIKFPHSTAFEPPCPSPPSALANPPLTTDRDVNAGTLCSPEDMKINTNMEKYFHYE